MVLEFASFREFIDDYSPYISPSGMFLLDSGRAVGDDVAFEVRLSDDFRLIHGTGTVEWAVPQASAGHPAGVALRFSELDQPSRRLVARLVDNHRNAGGSPFDIDDRPAAASDLPVAEEPGLPLSADLGTETIALPVSLTGMVQEEEERQAVIEESISSPPAELDPAASAAPGPPAGVELPPDPTPFAAEPELPAAIELEPESAEIGRDAAAVELPPVLLDKPESVPAAPEFDAAATQIVDVPEDLRIPPKVAMADAADLGPPPGEDGTSQVLTPEDLERLATSSEPKAGESFVPAPPAELPPPADFDVPELDAAPADTGFEPAELPHEPEIVAGPEPEELLPVLPVEGDAIDETPLPDLSVPERIDEVVAGAAVPLDPEPPATVEMPDDGNLVDDYYRTSGPKPRRTFLWVSICLLAVALGAAAWMYRDVWMGYLPESLTGGRPATVAQTDPAAGGEPVDPSTDPPEPMATTDPAPGDEAVGVGLDPETTGGEDESAVDASDPTSSSESTDEPVAAEPAAVPDDRPVEPPTEPTEPEAATKAASTSASTELPARVNDLAFRLVDGVTEVRIVTDARIAADGYEVVRVAAPPARQVIKIYGPDAPYPREAVAVGTEHVRRLRTGFHRVDGRGEVHIVADLTGPGVAVLDTKVSGSSLIVRFGSR